MNYDETIAYLFKKVPSFQKVGAAGYKEGLSNTFALDAHFGHPHTAYPTIHIAGTNGKGSTAHTLAAILQDAGYRVGLYTSPHLIDFRERIRVNGEPASEDFVVRFVEENRAFFEPLQPSFFELTTAMAFLYFKQQKVDVAVIEVGLGGRLDCTNIITPCLSVITNISFDHMQFLGHTLAAIASEKAGIIKQGVPVIVGETTPETRPVFAAKAQTMNAPVTFAEDTSLVSRATPQADGGIDYDIEGFGILHGQLGGLCQEKNTNTILHAVSTLRQLNYHISDENIRNGFSDVVQTTGLMGRWQRIHTNPIAVCDTGHNEGGFTYIVRQLAMQKCKHMRIVFGMVSDKDIEAVLSMLPKEATYYFTQAAIARALPAKDLQAEAAPHLLKGNSYPDVKTAYEAALADASADDFIYVGGSSYVVADLLVALSH
jgi:dihydrofolate synthase/folylpolyglutamate synthase